MNVDKLWESLLAIRDKISDSDWADIEEAFKEDPNPIPDWPQVNGILDIPRDRFEVGQYVFAEWDEKPNLIHRVSEDSYMIMRGPNKSIPQWLYFKDALSSLEAAEKHPEYAYLYRSKS